jgi:hypothetical protein
VLRWTYFFGERDDCEQARLPDQVAHSICVVRLFLFLGILLIALFSAEENLLIVDVYARIVPEGQIEPIQDPFIEAIVSGKQGPLPAGVQQVQGKTFQIAVPIAGAWIQLQEEKTRNGI